MSKTNEEKRVLLRFAIQALIRRLQSIVLMRRTPQVTDGLKPAVQRGAEAIIIEMAQLGHPVRITQGLRSIAEQNRLFNQGRTTPGAIVTNARGGQSFHNYGVAVDFVFVREGYNASQSLWELLGKVGEARGFEWGGRWTTFLDRPHFELRMGYTLSHFQNDLIEWSNYN